MVSDKNAYESFGMNLRRLRKEINYTQNQLALKTNIARTTINRYESGKLIPTPENIAILEKFFKLRVGDLARKTAIVIPDTSALLKNKRLVDLLLEDYEQIVIPDVIQNELSSIKNAIITENSSIEDRKKQKHASEIMSMLLLNIDSNERIIRMSTAKYDISPYTDATISVGRIIELAKDIQSKKSRLVHIIHVNKDIPSISGEEINSFYLDEYMALRKNGVEREYRVLMDLDLTFDHLERYESAAEKMNLNTILPDGRTLLISCIRCNDPDKTEEHGGRIIPDDLICQKLEFLLKHGADPNLTDCNHYCHTPLAHCIEGQFPNFEAFRILLKYGADYNKGSVDSTKSEFKRISEINEGNTPLMIACWHGEIRFIEELLSNDDLSINQQDCNGYTALIKCAVKRYMHIVKGAPHDKYDKIYKMLIERKTIPADQLIRDRNNHTALDWWKRGDDFSYKANEIWGNERD